MFPPKATAASLVPSLEEVMPCQSFVLPTEVSSVQVAPESVEVQMFPTRTVAASLVPSLEEVMPCQSFVLPTEVSSVQVAAYEGVRTLSDNKATSRTLRKPRRGIVRIRRFVRSIRPLGW